MAGALGLQPLSAIWGRNGQPLDLVEDTLNTGDIISFKSRVDVSINTPNLDADLDLVFTPPTGSMLEATRKVLGRDGHEMWGRKPYLL